MKRSKLGIVLTLAVALCACTSGPQMPLAQQEQAQVLASVSLPYYSTSTYQVSPGRVDATCTPTLTGTECSGTASGPQYATFNWRHVYNYAVVQVPGRRLVIECSANVRWSKCGRPEPGAYTLARSGDKVELQVWKDGKPTLVTFNILAEAAQ